MGLRKNQSTLTAAEKKAFVNALLALKQRPSKLHPGSANHSRFDDFVEVHLNAMLVMTASHGHHAVSWGHMAAAFGPWHRVLLFELERELQAIDPTVTLPYWDWTTDRKKTSSLWKADFLGGNGGGADTRVADGAFAGANGQWPIRIKDDPGDADFLRRDMAAEPSAPELPKATLQRSVLKLAPYDVPPWDDMMRDQTDANDWRGFRIGLEISLHNLVHRWVGGNMMDMTSPNDPVFWLHHCNCDRLWFLWQVKHPEVAAYLPGNSGPMGHNLNDPMIFHAAGEPKPWEKEYRPADVIDHRTMGTAYDSDPPGAPPIPIPVIPPAPPGPAPHHAPMRRAPAHAKPLPMFALASEIPALKDR